jgi:hypothetical protein
MDVLVRDEAVWNIVLAPSGDSRYPGKPAMVSAGVSEDGDMLTDENSYGIPGEAD